MSNPTCSTCASGIFSLTPTGRVQRNKPGRCGKQNALREQVLSTPVAPCLAMLVPRNVSIWPNYDATYCPGYEAK